MKLHLKMLPSFQRLLMVARIYNQCSTSQSYMFGKILFILLFIFISVPTFIFAYVNMFYFVVPLDMLNDHLEFSSDAGADYVESSWI